jgi:hypothetical protein
MEIIIIAAVVVVIVIVFFYSIRGREKRIKERLERINRASKGRAKILSSKPAGLSGTGYGGKYDGYTFMLEVSDGYTTPYNAEVIWEVYPMGVPKVQTGAEINVKIDAEDKMLVYPDADGIAFSWNGLMMLMAKKL